MNFRGAKQLTAGDAWNSSCYLAGKVNCPDSDGPDFDFASSASLVTLRNGRRALLLGQKSGMAYAIDPDRRGGRGARGGFKALCKLHSCGTYSRLRVRRPATAVCPLRQFPLLRRQKVKLNPAVIARPAAKLVAFPKRGDVWMPLTDRT